MKSGLPPAKDVSTQRIRRMTMSISHDEWPAESLEWEKKIDDLVVAIDHTDRKLRSKLWDKVDKAKTGRLDAYRSLERLIFSFILLYIKTNDRHGQVPKYSTLQPFLVDIATHVRGMLESGSKHIEKDDFINNIGAYMNKVLVKHRQNKAKIMSSEVSMNATVTELLRKTKK